MGMRSCDSYMWSEVASWRRTEPNPKDAFPVAFAAAVPNRVRTIETQSPARPVWDNASLLMILVILLGLEWALRKRFKLL